MSDRYMIKKTTNWNGEVIFKIFDKDLAQLSYAGYTTYEAARDICQKKNQKKE